MLPRWKYHWIANLIEDACILTLKDRLNKRVPTLQWKELPISPFFLKSFFICSHVSSVKQTYIMLFTVAHYCVGLNSAFYNTSF